MTRYAIILALLSVKLVVADPRGPQITLQSPEHVLLGVHPKRVQIDVIVSKGFHLQANPVSRAGLIPTEIQLEASPLFQFSSFTYPKGTPLRLSQEAGEILIYSGNFPVSFELARQPNQVTKRKLVKGLIHYQACDDHVCMRPSSQPFEFWVESPK